MASLVFGAATFALSTVLAVFFAGLALGSYFSGRYSSRTDRPLRVYAGLEIGVGVLVLLSPVSFILANAIYGWFYPLVVNSFTLLSLTRFLLVAVLLLPSATLMGATLPLFCRQYVVNEKRISLSIGFLYGINTLGAAAGCAACGFFLMPRFGVNATLYAGGIVNILIGMIVWMLPLKATAFTPGIPPGEKAKTRRRKSASRSDEREQPQPPLSARATSTLYSLFFISGFVALGSEILWTRYLSLLMHNTAHTYTLTLTVILVGIVAGSILTAGFFDRSRRRAFIFGTVQITTGIATLTALMMPATMWTNRLNVESIPAQLANVMLVMFVPAVLSGVSFPLAVRMVVDQPTESGIGVGKMTAVNTVGGIIGSLAIGFFLMPLFGLQVTLLITTGASLSVGFAVWLLLDRTLRRPVQVGMIVAAIAIWMAIPFLTGTRLPADFLASSGKLVDYREGLRSFMAVVHKDRVLKFEIDRLWQGGDRKNPQIMAAHVPMLLHPDPKQVMVIGMGPGQTAGRFLMHPIDNLDCIEIESELVPFVKKYYDSKWMDDRRVRFIIEDGRNYLTHTDATYDLISIEVGQVFRPGAASFYTADFYQRARRRLNPDGMLCQFLPILFFNVDECMTIVRTFLDTFPQSVLWYNRGELLLVGSTANNLKLKANRLSLLETDDVLHRELEYAYWGGVAHYVNQPEVFVASFLLGPQDLAKFAGTAPVYRDDRPYLEYTTTQTGKGATELIVNRIKDHLGPISLGLERGIDVEIDRVEELRRRNLDDIIAASIHQEMPPLNDLGDHRNAVQWYRRALKFNDRNAVINLFLGVSLAELEQFDEAMHYFRKSVEIDPISADGHNNIGAVLLVQGKLGEAVACFNKALAIEPDYSDAHHHMGIALGRLGKLDTAIHHFRRTIELDPHHADARRNLGIALQNSGADSRGK